MLSEELNEKLTRVGPGTPMGDLMRRYWHPIAATVEQGLRAAGASYEVCLDRERAIERAVSLAGPGDVVLIAGKGHETYQLIGGLTLPFDDREQARLALGRRRARRSATAG